MNERFSLGSSMPFFTSGPSLILQQAVLVLPWITVDFVFTVHLC